MEIDSIYLGDAYELIKRVPSKSVDLIVTDPPYEIRGLSLRDHGLMSGRKKGTFEMELAKKGLGNGIDLGILDEFVRVLKRINIYIWCNKEQIYDYLDYFAKKRKCNFEIIVWAKGNVPPFVGGHYLKDKEYCLYFWERGVKVMTTFERGKTVYLTDVNKADKAKYGHPTIKPQSIIENLIANSCGGVDIRPVLRKWHDLRGSQIARVPLHRIRDRR